MKKFLWLLTACTLSCSQQTEGNMPTTNGIITAPVTVSDVAHTLGVNSTDVGYLCYNTHGKINKWSAKKPLALIGSPLPLDDSVFKKNDFGLDVDDAQMTSINLNDLFVNKEWQYIAPAEGDWARLTDFEGYNHNAVCPVSCQIECYNTQQGGNITVYFAGDMDGADMVISDFQRFAHANCVWGFAYRVKGSKNAFYVGWDENQGGSPQNPVTSIASLSATVADGTYEVIGLIHRTNDKYYLLPNAYKVVEARQLTAPEAHQISGWISIYVDYGNKNYIYSTGALKNHANYTRNFFCTCIIEICDAKGTPKTTIYSAKDVKVTLNAGEEIKIPFGDNIEGDEGITRDESGASNRDYYYKISYSVFEEYGVLPIYTWVDTAPTVRISED